MRHEEIKESNRVEHTPSNNGVVNKLVGTWLGQNVYHDKNGYYRWRTERNPDRLMKEWRKRKNQEKEGKNE